MAAPSVQRPRGTRDFAPTETAARHHAAERLRGVFRRFGYHEVQTPTFEELELFTAKSGEGVVQELYDFTDKGERRMCLRPELTAPTMRFYFQEHAFDPKPLKWYYFGNCFRYDRPQAGRYREFWQFGCEQIGAGTPLAYAELLALADNCLRELGLKAIELYVGHVKLLGRLVDGLALPADARRQAMRLIDKRDDDGLRALCTGLQVAPGLFDALLTAMDAPDLATARRHVGDDPAFAELEETFRHLEAFGVRPRLNLGIARGLDYYTGIVFEAHCPLLGAEKQLLGGGGYDLSAVFGAQPTPTMGFGLGFDRLLVALEKEGVALPGPAAPDVYLAAIGDAAQAHVVQAATALRAAGLAVDLDLLGRRPGQVAKHADALGARLLVVLGDRDLQAGSVRVKRLGTGEEEDVPLAGLVQHVRAASA